VGGRWLRTTAVGKEGRRWGRAQIGGGRGAEKVRMRVDSALRVEEDVGLRLHDVVDGTELQIRVVAVDPELCVSNDSEFSVDMATDDVTIGRRAFASGVFFSQFLNSFSRFFLDIINSFVSPIDGKVNSSEMLYNAMELTTRRHHFPVEFC